MAKFSFQMPEISTDDLTDREAIKKVQSYLFQMNEQLRYMMMNLDSENMAEGAVTENLLAEDVRNILKNLNIRADNAEAQIKITGDGIRARLTDIEGDMTELQATAEGLAARISNAEGDITTLQATAEGLGVSISNAQGDITSLQATAQGLATRISNAEGSITTLQATAGSLSASVSSLQGDVSSFQQTAQAIGLSATGIDLDAATGNPQIKGSNFIISQSGIQINSTGALTVNTAKFGLDSNGNATFAGTLNSPTGNFGGMVVNQYGMYRQDQCVRLLAQNGDFGAEWTMMVEEPTSYDPGTGDPIAWDVTNDSAIRIKARTFFPNEKHVEMYDAVIQDVLEAVTVEANTAKITKIMVWNGTSYVDKTGAILAL